ncbi:hypothetical protein EMPG_13689 [Blastomyces silverae]|uniref:Uncharacterized protein n=1 Tax=Blastomyces silverae TaxID=2060906 RepID=A0A0H1BHM9_9EURO|nr:hypothetical protein EMPG_13689 [Blastomyces silverae]
MVASRAHRPIFQRSPSAQFMEGPQTWSYNPRCCPACEPVRGLVDFDARSPERTQPSNSLPHRRKVIQAEIRRVASKSCGRVARSSGHG